MATSLNVESLVKPGSRFLAKVDVTNFYGSIYTHSFPWAVHGLRVAKTNRDDKNDWVNNLDFVIRQARRRETTGISVGPGTSAVAGEILLGQVDAALRASGYDFVRYIDDYFFVSTTRDIAEAFISAVRDELAQIKLSIHPGKTSISQMPLTLSPGWMRRLRSALRGPTSLSRILDAIDEAIEIASSDTEEGVLRYLLVAIEVATREDGFPQEARSAIVDRLLHIGFLRPVAVGTACRVLESMGAAAITAREAELNLILKEHARALRTDAATWLLHTLVSNGMSPTKPAAKAVVRAGDCLMMALLAEDPAGMKRVIRFLTRLEKQEPENYRRDEYWLLYYQFALRGRRWATVASSYYEEFEPLLKANVSFVNLRAENPYGHVQEHGDPRRMFGGGNSMGGPYPD